MAIRELFLFETSDPALEVELIAIVKRLEAVKPTDTMFFQGTLATDSEEFVGVEILEAINETAKPLGPSSKQQQ